MRGRDQSDVKRSKVEEVHRVWRVGVTSRRGWAFAACAKRAYTGADAHGEKDSLSSGVAGAQIRHEIASAFVAQSLLSAGPFARLARRHARPAGPARCAE